LLIVGGATTVMLADAGVFGPSFEVIGEVMLFFTPEVVPVMLTLMVQFPLAATVPPERLIVPEPAVAVAVPPQKLVRRSASIRRGPAEDCR
jgi:hypothetical protein